MDEERLLDPVTAVSGSGPAYVFWFIEQLAASREELGIAADDARKLALQTLLGAAKLASAVGGAAGAAAEERHLQGRHHGGRAQRVRAGAARASASRRRSRPPAAAAPSWATSWGRTEMFAQIGIFLVDTMSPSSSSCCSRASISSGCACRSAIRWANSCSHHQLDGDAGAPRDPRARRPGSRHAAARVAAAGLGLWLAGGDRAAPSPGLALSRGRRASILCASASISWCSR